MTLNSNGSQTVTITDVANGAILGQFTITIDGKPPTQLAFVQQPANGVAGAALSPSITVAVQDEAGSIVTGNSSVVTLTIHSGPGSCDRSSTVQVAAINGVATISNLLFDVDGTYSLTATDGSLTSATSGTFVMDAASPSQLAFLLPAAAGAAGVALNPP